MSVSELSFTLRNDRAELVRMTDLLEDFCRRLGVSEDDLFNARLCLDEAVINVVVHGYEEAGEPAGTHAINVSLVHEPGILTIRIDDDGVAYNPLDAPAPRFDLPLEERGDGGLGVHIIKTLAHHVGYRRDGGLWSRRTV